MTIGKVIGNIVSTITSDDYEYRTILIIQPVDYSGKNTGLFRQESEIPY